MTPLHGSPNPEAADTAPQKTSGKAFHPISPMQITASFEASQAIAEAHRMYRRMLAGWAQDVLLLRGKHGGGLRWRASTDDAADARAA